MANSAITNTVVNADYNDVAVSDLANGTDGELITWDASGNPATVAVGTSGQVLTSNGVGAAPTFQDAGGGGTSIAAVAEMSTSQSITGSWQKIDFDTEIEDLGGDYDTTTQRFTVPTGGGGLYHIGFKVYCSADVTNVAIYKNGSSAEVHTAIPANRTRDLNRVLKLSASDYIEAYLNGGSGLIYSGNFYIYKI